MKIANILSILVISCCLQVQAQIHELNFNHQNINFSAPPRTAISPMSIRLWDNYNNGGPAQYGTVLELYGLGGHQTSQLHFGGWDNSRIRYREAFYAQNTWSDWVTLLDSKNHLESAGNLMLTGGGNHYLSNGRLGIRTMNPFTAVQIGDFGNGDPQNHIVIPGTYNFEQLRLGQVGNGNQALEFVNHTGLNASYGIKLAANVDQIAGLQIQYAPSQTAYGDLSYTTAMHFGLTGNVGIGILNANEKLSVNGKIRAKEIKVESDNWPDYVFNTSYKLPSLLETEQFIKENHHLPDIPSAAEVEKDGVNLGEMNARLLKKIEELTLHLIAKDKELSKERLTNEAQQAQLSDLMKRLEILEKIK
jgi:hypothetical protein